MDWLQATPLVYHTEITVAKDGTLVLQNLPFKKGQRVEITVYGPEATADERADPLSLRNEPLIDTDPFEPIALEDWEVLL